MDPEKGLRLRGPLGWGLEGELIHLRVVLPTRFLGTSPPWRPDCSVGHIFQGVASRSRCSLRCYLKGGEGWGQETSTGTSTPKQFYYLWPQPRTERVVEPGCVRLRVKTELVVKVKKQTWFSKSPPETWEHPFSPVLIIRAWASSLIYLIMLYVIPQPPNPRNLKHFWPQAFWIRGVSSHHAFNPHVHERL